MQGWGRPGPALPLPVPGDLEQPAPVCARPGKVRADKRERCAVPGPEPGSDARPLPGPALLKDPALPARPRPCSMSQPAAAA